MRKHNFIRILFYIVLTVCTLGAAVLVYKIHFAIYPFFSMTLLCGLMVSVGGFYVLWKTVFKSALSSRSIILISILVGAMLRIITINLMDTFPVSDFYYPFDLYYKVQGNGWYTNSEQLDYFQKYYAAFPAWYAFMKVVFFFLKIFPTSAVAALKMFNIVLFGLTELVIYRISSMFSDATTNVVLLGGMLWAVSPTMIFYSSVICPDHYTILFFTLIIYQLLKFWLKTDWKNAVLLAMWSAAMNLFKPLSVFSVCLVIGVLGLRILYMDRHNITLILKKISFFLIIFALVVGSTTMIEHQCIKRDFNVKVVDSTAIYFFGGYYLDKDGNYVNWTNDVVGEILTRNGDDLEKAYDELGKAAKDQFIRNFNKLPYILSQKYEFIVGTEYSTWMFANTSKNIELEESLNAAVQKWFMFFSEMFMFVAYSFSIIAMLAAILHHKTESSAGLLLDICSMIAFGYMLVLILGAVQDRYKNIMFTSLLMIAAFGADTTFSAIGKAKNNVYKHLCLLKGRLSKIIKKSSAHTEH